MNKKGIILLAVMIIAGGAVFASGQQDVNEDGVVVVNGRDQVAPEEITLNGRVEFTSTGTKLTAGGEEWTLLYPMHLVNIEIEDGTRVTVTGFEPPAVEDVEAVRGNRTDSFDRGGRSDQDARGPRGRMNFDEDEKVLRVTSAVIDGVTYELDFGREDGMMGRGGRMNDKQSSRMGGNNRW